MSDREERRRRLVQLGSAAAFLAIVVVAVLIVISQSQTEGGDTNLEDVGLVNHELRGIPQEGLALGRAAPVKLVEFGDLQCPSCRAVAEDAMPGLIDSRVRNGSARLEFRNFVIIGDESTPAGAAAIAAGMQGHGWNFIELFYRNQGTENSGYVTDEFLTSLAKSAGVPDIARWNRDRRSNDAIAQVERSTEEADGLGFDGTPSFAVESPGTKGLEPLGFLSSTGDLEAAVDKAR
ncbi:MAG TPA: thioredoxin domain-containing protein [Solirubrobacterales bacterium]